jgi:hypothetical protein
MRRTPMSTASNYNPTAGMPYSSFAEIDQTGERYGETLTEIEAQERPARGGLPKMILML